MISRNDQQSSKSAQANRSGRWKSYSAYKDSGVEWLGQVPEHWEIIKLKHVVTLKSGEGITSETINQYSGFPVYGGNGLRGYTDSYTHDGHFVLIGRQGALCGNINYGEGRFFASEHAVVATPNIPIAVVWLGELLRAVDLNQYSISAAQPGLAVDRIKDLFIPQPPLSEQCAIAAFLDRETTKIDILIAKKQRLIELLQEKRTALISQAVSKGLDTNVPMKDSGVEWLGEVPEHWKVKRLKYFADINPSKSELNAIDRKIYVSFVPMELVGFGDLSLVVDRVLEDVYQGFTYFVNGDVLIAKITPSFENGKGAIAKSLTNGIGFGTTELHILRPNALSCSDYLYYLSMSHVFRTIGAVFMCGTAGQKRVEDYFIINFPSPLPLRSEQRAIAAFLDRETAKIDNLIAKVQAAIQKLQEYRNALISAAVTGKIDVRDVASVDSEVKFGL